MVFLVLFILALIFQENRLARPLFYLLIFSTFVYIVVQKIGLVYIPVTNPLSSLILGKEYLVVLRDFAYKYNCMRYAHPFPIWELFLAGTFILPLIKWRKMLPVAFVASSILLFYFLPDSWTFRINRELAPFMAVILAYVTYYMYKLLSRLLDHLPIKRENKLRTEGVFFMLLILSISLPLTQPYIERSSTVIDKSNGTQSVIASYEYELARWIKENTPKNTRIISDSFTMFILNGLSNRISVVQPAMSTRPLSSEEVEKLSTIKYVLKSLLQGSLGSLNVKQLNVYVKELINKRLLPILTSPYEIDKSYAKMLGFSSPEIRENIIIVVSSRTLRWVQMPSGALSPTSVLYPSYQAIDISRFPAILNSGQIFEILYKDPLNRFFIVKVNLQTLSKSEEGTSLR